MLREERQRLDKQVREMEQLLQMRETDINRLRGMLKAAQEDSANKTAGIEKAEVVIKKLNAESQLILDENARVNEDYERLEKQAREME